MWLASAGRKEDSEGTDRDGEGVWREVVETLPDRADRQRGDAGTAWASSLEPGISPSNPSWLRVDAAYEVSWNCTTNSAGRACPGFRVKI